MLVSSNTLSWIYCFMEELPHTTDVGCFIWRSAKLMETHPLEVVTSRVGDRSHPTFVRWPQATWESKMLEKHCFLSKWKSWMRSIILLKAKWTPMYLPTWPICLEQVCTTFSLLWDGLQFYFYELTAAREFKIFSFFALFLFYFHTLSLACFHTSRLRPFY